VTTAISPRISLAGVTRPGPDVNTSVREFSASVVRQQELDPVLTEIVRLRCAAVHDCRLCGSLRTESALQHGLDRGIDAVIDRYETSHFDERTKVALRFTDAMIMDPGHVSAELRAQVRTYFTDAQVAELALDIMKWSQQKALVALRLETPPREGLSLLSFDENGDATIGGALA
jgi:Carboxymuconolactone decarboxylase family